MRSPCAASALRPFAVEIGRKVGNVEVDVTRRDVIVRIVIETRGDRASARNVRCSRLRGNLEQLSRVCNNKLESGRVGTRRHGLIIPAASSRSHLAKQR
jgi:hypothetical protein